MFNPKVEVIRGYGEFDVFADITQEILGEYIKKYGYGQVFYGITDDVQVVKRYLDYLRTNLPPTAILGSHDSCSLLDGRTISITFQIPKVETHRLLFRPNTEIDIDIVDRMMLDMSPMEV
jgi:hypothetical protein